MLHIAADHPTDRILADYPTHRIPHLAASDLVHDKAGWQQYASENTR